MKTLRPYQEEACDFIDKQLKNYRRPFIYCLACGTGKSLVIAELAKRWGRTLVLTVSAELCRQDLEEMREQGVDAVPYSASLGEKLVGDITVATIGSAYKHPELFSHTNIVVIDEVQMCDCSRTDSMFMKLLVGVNKIKLEGGERIKIVGLTATAWRNVQKSEIRGWRGKTTTMLQPLNRIPMKGGFLWSDITEGITTREALERGYLTPVEYYASPSDTPLTVNKSGSEFTDESLDEWGNNIISDCLSAMLGCEKTWNIRSGIVALPFISHAESLYEVAKQKGLSCIVVSSKTPQKAREEAIRAFKEGGIRWLIQCNIANVGFNSPITDTLIWARPTLSLNLWFQAVGRVMRKAEGKEVARVLDLVGTSKTFGLPENIHLGKEDGFKTTIECGKRKLSGIPLKTFYWHRNIKRDNI